MLEYPHHLAGYGKIRGYLVQPHNLLEITAVLVVHENRALIHISEDIARRIALDNYRFRFPTPCFR